ncbi:MAG: sulfonate ABC transporter substrate-binding protein, partial [Candidatus Acinetobacter avistercoris]|nr:sulfonate ABC transporter substrate-binding protein [Candidatus Acinetobacter avistercoris]
MHTIKSKFMTKTVIITSLVAGAMLISGCGKKEAETVTLNIGFQKYGILPIVKERGTLEKTLKDQGVNIRWVEFPAGPQLLEGLNVGSVAFGEAGEAPPIFAQAANSNLVYVANQPAAPKAEALIVQKDSNIKTVQDLKGKRIALNKGSNVHYLLLKVLEANKLKLEDIDVVYLPPSDARAAFERGAVDAWVIWDPFFAAAEQQIGARVIATGQNLVSNHQFYLADRKFAEKNPNILKTVVAELNETTQWVAQNQNEASKLLEKPTGLSFDILKSSISRMGFGVKPISA